MYRRDSILYAKWKVSLKTGSNVSEKYLRYSCYSCLSPSEWKISSAIKVDGGGLARLDAAVTAHNEVRSRQRILGRLSALTGNRCPLRKD